MSTEQEITNFINKLRKTSGSFESGDSFKLFLTKFNRLNLKKIAVTVKEELKEFDITNVTHNIKKEEYRRMLTLIYNKN